MLVKIDRFHIALNPEKANYFETLTAPQIALDSFHLSTYPHPSSEILIPFLYPLVLSVHPLEVDPLGHLEDDRHDDHEHDHGEDVGEQLRVEGGRLRVADRLAVRRAPVVQTALRRKSSIK